MSKAMQLKAKIKNLALKNHVPAQAVLQNFMLERLLERISLSKYARRKLPHPDNQQHDPPRPKTG